jgi:hypothetical protein
MPQNFNGRLRNALDLCQDSSLDNLLENANDDEGLLNMSLRVMRCGFTVIMLKLNNNPHTGRVLLHLAPRKVLSIKNSLLKVRKLIRLIWWF